MTGRYFLVAITGVMMLLMMAFFFWGVDAKYPWMYAFAVMVLYVYYALWARFHPVGHGNGDAAKKR